MLRGAGQTVAVAIDRDKGSQNALKWATDNVAEKGSSLILIHVQERAASMASPNLNGEDKEYKKQMEIHSRELFAPFRCFCSRKDIKVEEILLEHTDVAKAITDYLKAYSIDVTVLGAATRNGFMRRFKGPDIPTSVTKMAPDFCTVYVISKGKVSATRSGIPCPSGISGAAPRRHQLTNQASHLSDTQTSFSYGSRIKEENKVQSAPVSFTGNGPEEYNVTLPTQNLGSRVSDHYKAPLGPHNMNHDTAIKSPFDRARNSGSKFPGDHSPYESDISFVSSAKPSTGRSSPFYDSLGYALSNSNSNSSDTQNRSFGAHSGSPDLNYTNNFSSSSGFTGISLSSENGDDVEAEMKRLKLELKQTMDMYSSACNEALSAKQKARELHHWKLEEEHRIEEVQLAQEAALALAEREKAKCRAAIETAEASQKIAEREARKRLSVEMKARRESDEKKAALDALSHSNVRYRKYTIEEIETATDYFQESLQIGEGGYGPVYKCYLDHTPVAVKALRPDAAHGRSQFQQEVEVLSCIRHPNMVLLLGACPEYGCLVYEYMANGSLEDRLFRRGNTPVLPWQLRFKIAAEIGTGLLFLHQTKPKPLVHRDLKPANILLDHNFVSKISDVGLARLVPPSVANSVTQYHMTSAAGTFCYIDPEYQQTGMLGIKSDVYSLGIILLQIITAKPPMGLAHHVEGSIEGGTFAQILDPDVSDWPMDETLCFAKLALQCAELRRKDRPDLGKVLLPELNRLRVLAEKYMHNTNFWSSPRSSPTCSQFSISQDKMNSMPTQDNGNE